jgi:hypothetical protein
MDGKLDEKWMTGRMDEKSFISSRPRLTTMPDDHARRPRPPLHNVMRELLYNYTTIFLMEFFIH